ncbi:restriction endonuclease [Candidatus Saccharibacteria bacterium]|nr:restriction endonuclease [Candidatus Saccharibacteria bacterium]
MARRYKRNGSFLDEAAGLITILVLVVGYTKYNEIKESNPDLLPFIYIGAVILILLVAIFVVHTVIKNIKIKKTFTMSDIDNMNGVKFEYYLADILRKRGFTNVKVTEKYDLGVDIIAQKDGVTWGIQAKRYSSIVKLAAVRAAYTALSHYKCERAMVVTNNYFSNPAKTLASETKTVLIDRDTLAKWVYEASQQR